MPSKTKIVNDGLMQRRPVKHISPQEYKYEKRTRAPSVQAIGQLLDNEGTQPLDLGKTGFTTNKDSTQQGFNIYKMQ